MSNKNLLIITQTIDKDDHILGFFHSWVAEFAKQCDQVTVIALGVGKYELPKNVKVLSLGKFPSREGCPQGGGVCYYIRTKLKYILNFYKLIWAERKNYDSVFVHMNPEYVILGWLSWKILGKKIGLWFAHKNVTLILKIAEKLTDIIFTSTMEGFRLSSHKLKIVGQGVDTEKFKSSSIVRTGNNFNIVTVGRISPSKDYDTLIKAIEILIKNTAGNKVNFKIIGGPATEKDKNYLDSLREKIKAKNLSENIEFIGPCTYDEINSYLTGSDIFISASQTGSLDKALLEAMSAGLQVVSCNDSFKNILNDNLASICYFEPNNFSQLAEKVNFFLEGKNNIGNKLREIVVKDHSLNKLVNKIILEY